MSTLVRFILVLSIFLSSSIAVASENDALQFYTHSASHAIIEDETGKVSPRPGTGRRAIDIAVVSQIIDDAGLTNNIKNYPFNRALRKVQTQDNIALFNVLRTPDRESTVHWVGPLNKYTSYFYESVEKPTNIRTREDAKRVNTICVLSGNVHHSTLLRLGFQNLVLGDSYTQCADLLLKGRVSLMPAGENPRLLKREGFDGKIQRTPVDIATRRGYLALSLNISEETVNRLQESFDKLIASEEYQKILDDYSGED